MKKNFRNWIYSIVIIGSFLMLTASCKKGDDSNNPTSSGTVKDVDGNVYHTVIIGTQVWMVENLQTTKYRNGDLIGTTIPDTLDINSQISPKYQWAFGGNENNVAKYGRLYTWYAATDNRKIAPTGWHVPTDDEWTTLEDYLSNNLGISGSVAKTLAAKTDWSSSTIDGTIGNNLTKNNSSGFAALPGGYRLNLFNPIFRGVGNSGSWWSSTDSNAQYGWQWFRSLHSTSNYVYRGNGGDGGTGTAGFSVRCVKD